MSDRCYQPEFITGLRDIYRNHPYLWNIKSKHYSNRQMREQAYSALLQYYKTVNEKATVDTVKNKINNLRSSFRKELKKANESKKSGSGSEQVDVPKLWYFKLLMFMSDQETPLQPISNDSDYEHDTEDEISDNEMFARQKSLTEPVTAGNSSFSKQENTKETNNAKSNNKSTSKPTQIVQERKTFWETVFKTEEGKATLSKIKNCPLKHTDSLLHKKSLNHLHKKDKKLKKYVSIDENLDVCCQTSLEARTKLYLDKADPDHIDAVPKNEGIEEPTRSRDPNQKRYVKVDSNVILINNISLIDSCSNIYYVSIEKESKIECGNVLLKDKTVFYNQRYGANCFDDVLY